MVRLRSAHRLAAVVVALGLIGGIALIFAGAQYGLSSRSGVGPGTFPAAAGVLLALASVLWGIGLLRTPPPAATPLLEAGLGPDLTHRIGEVERRADGHIELDESVTATAVARRAYKPNQRARRLDPKCSFSATSAADGSW